MFEIRPEGPAGSRPGRKAGIKIRLTMERQRRGTFLCRSFGPLFPQNWRSTPYGRGYSLTALRASIFSHVLWLCGMRWDSVSDITVEIVAKRFSLPHN
jgi:hypothetical protein